MSAPVDEIEAAAQNASALHGTFLLEDAAQLQHALVSGNWVEGGLATFSGAMDMAMFVADPLGSVIAMGYGYLLEHVEPLKGWLNDLTGDANEVAAFGEVWARIESDMHNHGDRLENVIRDDLYDMRGEAITAYMTFQLDTAKHLRAVGDLSGAMSKGLSIASTVVQVVHDITRDAVAQVCGMITGAILKAVFTLGLAIPEIIKSVTATVAKLAKDIGKNVDDLLKTVRNLKQLMTEADSLLDGIKAVFNQVVRGGRGGGTPELDAPVPGPKAEAPSIDGSVGGTTTAPSPKPDMPTMPKAPEIPGGGPPTTSGQSIADIMSGQPPVPKAPEIPRRKPAVDGPIQSGGRYGDAPRNPFDADGWAEDAYTAIRASNSDIDDIATTLNGRQLPNGRTLTVEDIAAIKDHIFVSEHPLTNYDVPGTTYMSRYDAQPEMAEAWGRLADGAPRDSDLTLLLHELTEMEYYNTHPGASYAEAHEAANQVANWYSMITGG